METNELTKPDSFIETELQRFEKIITKDQLVTLADSVKDLVIKDTEDKAGLKAVIEGRKLLKAQRVAIQKEAKNIRESAVRFQRAVILREDEYVGLVEPTEDVLAGREEWYYTEKARIDAENEKKESDRIQAMIDKLNAVHYAVDFHELKALTDVQFENILADATTKYNIALEEEKAEKQRQYELRLQEETRLAQAQKEQEERERLFKIEQNRINAENERIRKEQEERQRIIDEENQRIRNEQEIKNKELQDRQNELDRQEAERIRLQQLEEQKERTRIEEVKKARFEILLTYGFTYPLDDLGTMPTHQYELMESEHRKAHEEKIAQNVRKEQEEKKKREKEEKEEKLLQSSDVEKFINIFHQIDAIRKSNIWGTFKSKSGKIASNQIQDALNLAISYTSIAPGQDGTV